MLVGRGAITTRIFQLWQSRLPVKFPGNQITVSDKPSRKAMCLVVCENCSESALAEWLRGSGVSGVAVVSHRWPIECLKQGVLLPIDEFCLSLEGRSAAAPRVNIKPSEPAKSAHLIKPDTSGEKAATRPLAQLSRGTLQQPPSPLPPATTHVEESSSNVNKSITDMLDEFSYLYELSEKKTDVNEFRSQGYKRISDKLKTMPLLTHSDQLRDIARVGDKMRTTIQEILDTGKSKKLKALKEDPRNSAIVDLSRVWGVGHTSACKMFNQGVHSVQELRARGDQESLLNAQQQVGLKYLEELEIKIPRAEVQRIHSAVAEECARIAPEAECIVCGSYRRGRSECGDVDVLIVPREESGLNELPRSTLSALVLALEKSGFLTNHLSLPSGYRSLIESGVLSPESAGERGRAGTPGEGHNLSDALGGEKGGARQGLTPVRRDSSEDEGDGDRTRLYHGSRYSYMGVCLLSDPGIHRRIDMKIYPRSSLACALLYFTGNDHFNRRLRHHASKLGFALDDKALQQVTRDPSNQIIWRSNAIPCATEADVLVQLGVRYVKPSDRISFEPRLLLEAGEMGARAGTGAVGQGSGSGSPPPSAIASLLGKRASAGEREPN